MSAPPTSSDLLQEAKHHLLKGQKHAAKELLIQLIQKSPAPPESWMLLARLFQQEKKHPEAAQVLEMGLRQQPQISQLWYELGRVQLEMNQAEQALSSLHKAHRLSPQQVAILSVMGRAHHDLFQFEQAIRCYEQALELMPDHAGLWSDLGNIWRVQEQLDRAQACYQRSLALDPTHQASLTNQSLLQLIRNEPEGWHFFKHLRSKKTVRPGTQVWDGVIRPDLPLAIIEEYGRGDLIQMLRFVPRLIAAGQPCILYSPRAEGWSRLLKSMAFPLECDNTAKKTGNPPPYFIYDSDLPAHFGCAPHGDQAAPYFFPSHRPALPDSEDTRQNRLGLVWESGEFNNNRVHFWSYQQRSLALRELEPLFSAFPDKRFYSFQLGNAVSQLHHVKHPITDLQTLIHDFYDTAGLLQQMDLVITVDTAVAHLAGALGVPTYLLLSTSSDWRWGLHKSTSDWYPSLRLFRQSSPKDWAPVIQHLIPNIDEFFLRKD
ncbi:MAG: tetratricopeptide repeat protein [Candidatus Sericytochromatia bacterium]